MNKPHVHKDLIIAWANGAEIEYFDFDINKWVPTIAPDWCVNSKYRIKPQPKKKVMLYQAVITKLNGYNYIPDAIHPKEHWDSNFNNILKLIPIIEVEEE